MLADFISIHPILTYIIIGIVIGISSMVAVVVTIITYTNLRSARRKSATAAKEKPAKEKHTVSSREEKPTPKQKTIVKPQFSFLKKKLAFINFKRSSQQKGAPSDQPTVTQATPVPVPEVILNTANAEPEINATEFSVSLPPIEEQPASEATEVTTLMTDTSPVSLEESAQPQEEAESTELVETSTPDENEYQEEPKDDTFDLFTNDTEDESATNKFAADLSNVDVDDLLAEVLKFRNQFSKTE